MAVSLALLHHGWHWFLLPRGCCGFRGGFGWWTHSQAGEEKGLISAERVYLGVFVTCHSLVLFLLSCLNVGACTLDPMVGADRSQSQPPASALCCSRRVFVSSGALGSKWTCRALIHGCQVGRVSVPHWGCRMQRGACSWVLLSENHVSDNHELAQYEASPKAASAAQQEYLRSRGYHWLPTAP